MATFVMGPKPGSIEILEGSVSVGAANGPAACVVLGLFGGPEIDRQALAAGEISRPAQEAVAKMTQPVVEFSIKGEPQESAPGSGVWSVRFIAYVRDAK